MQIPTEIKKTKTVASPSVYPTASWHMGSHMATRTRVGVPTNSNSVSASKSSTASVSAVAQFRFKTQSLFGDSTYSDYLASFISLWAATTVGCAAILAEKALSAVYGVRSTLT